MHAAPAVRALLDDSRPERVLIACLYGLAAAAVVVWALAHAGVRSPLQVALAAAAAALTLAALGWRLARAALPGSALSLDWTGQRWLLVEPGVGLARQADSTAPLCAVVVALDLGTWQLLHLQNDAGRWRWQVVRAACVGPDWHGLQLALRFHAGHHTTHPADDPAEDPADQRRRASKP